MPAALVGTFDVAEEIRDVVRVVQALGGQHPGGVLRRGDPDDPPPGRRPARSPRAARPRAICRCPPRRPARSSRLLEVSRPYRASAWSFVSPVTDSGTGSTSAPASLASRARSASILAEVAADRPRRGLRLQYRRHAGGPRRRRRLPLRQQMLNGRVPGELRRLGVDRFPAAAPLARHVHRRRRLQQHHVPAGQRLPGHAQH